MKKENNGKELKSHISLHKDNLHKTMEQLSNKGRSYAHDLSKNLADLHFSCNQCNYSTTTQDNLIGHNELIHKKNALFCNKCGLQFTNHSSLMKHKAAIHEGIRYPCDQCDYKAILPSNLRKHRLSVHESVF